MTNNIDMTDIAQIDQAGPDGMSSAGALIHETVEQFEKAKDGMMPGEFSMNKFKKDHSMAIKAENKATGNVKNEKTDNDYTEKDGSTTTLIISNQENQGGIYVDKVRQPKKP